MIDLERIANEVRTACPKLDVQLLDQGTVKRVDVWGREDGQKRHFGGVERSGFVRGADADTPERIAVFRAILDAMERQILQ